MSVPAPQEQHTAQQDALRSADLSELLGHVHTCWDNERRSLSRQLHDSLGSSLTALTMHLGLLMQKLPPEPALQDRAGHMKKLLGQIVETNRQMQLKLWNDKLEFLGVRVALDELVTQFGEQRGITARCSLPEEELDCPRSHGIVLLHTLEEALRNIIQHAQASEVDVIVDDNEDEVMLTVKDNGVGLSGPVPAGESAGKFGLRMARERAAYLGGTLTLSAGAEGGVTLTMILPKPQPQPSAA
ncbi:MULTISPECIES: sensor histidine kinase [unclassified Duganella]|uniref:sensor histidine kinase n=1 Tax=unclassified Duganella TaxID=2636909 RepID=UPI000890AAED|nr:MULTISPECIES: ATP-binding protein [unclassified Duganella]SDF60697.1 Histidine kinase-, DNA gyrase B-, and HSP90-like ATPase [Duganella sp. OV458]SDI68080.1 Histidine kinase-, DNA gyrase B-, and HSP90-like ATPase [Duganella sp. OV510]